MPDRIVAITQLLLDTPEVSALVDGRVCAYELPDTLVGRMPLPVLIVKPAGGGALGGGFQQFSDRRIDIAHYAYTPQAANELFEVVYDTLKQMPRTVVGDTLLHWARPSGGPTSMREPGVGWPGGVPDNTVHWPFVTATWQVLAADIAIQEAA